MLEIKNLNTGYEKKKVVFVVSLIGPNGAGKSTILKATCGLIPSWSGEVIFDKKKLNGNEPPQNLKLGISFCPQGNRVFDELTVQENLEIGGYILKKNKVNERIQRELEIFPVLQGRLKQNAGSWR